MDLFEYKLGDTRPLITGLLEGVDATAATSLRAEIEPIAGGSAPFSPDTAAVVSVSAIGTKVSFAPPTAWITAGDYLGWFVAIVGGQTYRSRGFVCRVFAHAKTAGPDHPYPYGDGRGGYATVSDVSTLVMQRKNLSVSVNDVLIETLLGDTAFELDLVIQRMYALPILPATSPQAAAYLRMINKFWALGALYDLYVHFDAAAMNVAQLYREKGTQLLDDLVGGQTVLRDATPYLMPVEDTSTSATILPALDGDVTDGAGPTFTMLGFTQNGRLGL